MARREGKVIVPLHSALIRLQLEYCIHVWGPQHRKDAELLEMIRDLEHLSYEKRLRELSFLILEKIKVQGDLTATYYSVLSVILSICL